MTKQQAKDSVLFFVVAAILLCIAFLLSPRWGGRLLFWITFCTGFLSTGMAVTFALGDRIGGIIMLAASVASFVFISPAWGGRYFRWVAMVPLGILFLYLVITEIWKPGKPGDRCLKCKKEIFQEATVLSLQRMFLARNDPASAMKTEQSSGYVCTECTSRYCKACLERSAPDHAMGGKACPKCGGRFRVLS